MPGIGKTALADMHFKKWHNRFVFTKNIKAIREESDDESGWLKDILLNGKELNEKALKCSTGRFSLFWMM